MVMPALVKNFEEIRQNAERGPLHPAQFKMLKIYAKEEFPGAEELVQKCLFVGLKKKKLFAEIVRDTPRQEGESSIAWVRRIWEHCSKYVTKCPKIITVELLERYSQPSLEKRKNNLPVIASGTAKSFNRE